MDSLEEYLSCTLQPAVQTDVEAHLSICPGCREEVNAMREVSLYFQVLEAPQDLEIHEALQSSGQAALRPSPGFYANVRRQIGDHRGVPAFAGLFALDFAFGRRLAFASLLTLAVLGSYLVLSETEYPTGLSPAAVMAQQDTPAFDSAPAQDNMLVTMTTYEP